MIKGNDYIVEFLIDRGIKDVFGYPGGMVTHLMDSLMRNKDRIKTHINYHEQASAFAACGYSQITGKPTAVFATSGPGATNMITGIANAYFDSIPVIFISGQVNVNESKGCFGVRQRGFQETDIVSMVAPVTKKAIYVECVEDLPKCLNDAYDTAMEGRPGPVLLDIPMNLQRELVNTSVVIQPEICKTENNISKDEIDMLVSMIAKAKRPCIGIGSGGLCDSLRRDIKFIADNAGIPIVTSMLAVDALASDNQSNFGFIGSYGARHANMIIEKSDLIVTLGMRLDIRQVGAIRESFGGDAKLLRVDIDKGELSYPVKSDELQICADSATTISALRENIEKIKKDGSWLEICKLVKAKLNIDTQSTAEKFVRKISEYTVNADVITTDVGQNQIWEAQYYNLKDGDRMLFSGGHGAMGYSLPAAIGAHLASGKEVLCMTGDGGMQMNIQELAFISHANLPITVVVINNSALGMIRHFQEVYFDDRYSYTTPGNGYESPNFADIAKGYGIESHRVESVDEIMPQWFNTAKPMFIELCINDHTVIEPRLKFGHPTYDQEPLMPRELLDEILKL